MAKTPEKAEARIFYVETQLHMLARMPGGGVPREKALRAATNEVDKLKPAFDEWLTREMAALVDAIARAKHGEPQSVWLEPATTHCRQLHDVAGTMGFALVTVVADLLYKVLEGIAQGAECRLETITCYVDALNLVRQEKFRNLKPEDLHDLIDGLKQMAERVSGPTM
ncbi:hypothetical protein [Terrarubrum flagellatum]|uniref:hypothetical protein n=1 Tax=Terrirubrum flagellatum TaxID=2895980 RepID=UPI00314570CB